MEDLRRKTLTQAFYWSAAILVGFISIGFARSVSFFQHFADNAFVHNPWLFCILTPVLFVVAAAIVVLFAPQAKGSGIPQVLLAIHESQDNHRVGIEKGLVSLRTATLKVPSALIGILAGASIGREGPTVQISAAVFAWFGDRAKKFSPKVSFNSFLVAGGAAGVAAAFNTPLAGISFALEEIAKESFGLFQRSVMLSVIIGGITAQAVAGNYLYFGHPFLLNPNSQFLLKSVSIGVAGGLLGVLFAKLLSSVRWPKKIASRWWLKAFVCGLICSALIAATAGKASGSGYEITRSFMEMGGDLPPFFFIAKFGNTVFSYLSGMAGGIFSPCLSIGAGLGVSIGKLFHFVDLKSCALLGMVAFFSGAIQAPLTGVIIIMEMTDQHAFIIPLLIAAFVADLISKSFMPTSLYHFLAHQAESRVSAAGPIVREGAHGKV